MLLFSKAGKNKFKGYSCIFFFKLVPMLFSCPFPTPFFSILPPGGGIRFGFLPSKEPIAINFYIEHNFDK